MKILIVDDEKDILLLLKALLTEHGYNVETAMNGKEALDVLSKTDISLIITDILMPVMDGYQLCRKVKRDKKLCHIPVIFYTGTYTDPKDKELSFKMGANKYIKKPIDPEKIIEVIEEVISNPDLQLHAQQSISKEEDKEVLTLYNERLINKLEQKMLTVEEAEKKYRAIFESTGTATLIINADRTIAMANQEALRVTGYKPEELIGKQWTEFVAPESLEQMVKYHNLRREKPGTAPQRYDVRLINKSGESRYVVLNVGMIPNSSQSIVSLLDISERKVLEERYTSLVANLPVGVFRSTLDGTLISANPAMAIIYGFDSIDDLLKISAAEFYSDKSTRDEMLTELDEKDFLTDYITKNVKRDGTPIWVSTNYRTLRDENGQIKYIDNVMIDITERMQAEIKLKENESKYRTLFESASDIIYSMDTNLITIDVSPSIEKVLGYKPEELIGKPFQELNILAPESLEKIYMDTIRVLQGEEIKMGIYQFIAKDGTKRWGEISAAPLIRNGKVVSTISVARDVTERMEAESALRTSETQLSNAIEIAKLAYWEYDVLNDIFTFNDQFYNIYRTTAEKVGGYTMSSEQYAKRFVHPDDISVVADEVKKSIETKDPHFSSQVEHRIIYGDGEIGYIIVRFFVIKDEKGKTIKTFGVNQDITERRKAEKIQETIFNISNALNTTDNMFDLYSKIKEYLGNVIDTANFYIALYDEETDKISLSNTIDKKDVYDTFPAAKTLTKYVIRHGKPLFAPQKIQKELTDKGLIEISGTPPKIWLGAPLKVDNKVIGVIAVQSYDDLNRYKEKDLEILSFISEEVALAIKHKLAEEKIKKELKENNVLLDEIHHRIKNNLQMINSLLQLQQDTILTKEDAIKSFEVSQDRIRTMAKAYELLLQARYMSGIKLGEYLELIAEQLQRNYDPDKKIRISYSMDEIEFSTERLSKVGLIVNEILTNAIKYAFPDRDTGNIHIYLKDDENQIEIGIKDNGVGIPPDIDVSNPLTLGLSLIQMLILEFHGSCDVERDKGTSFIIRIPKL